MKSDCYQKINWTLCLLTFFIFNSCNQIEVTFYSPKNTVTNVSEKWLSRSGGEQIFIEGDFSQTLRLNVKIDDNTCTNLKIISKELLSCLTPANNSIKNVELKVLNGKQVSAKYDLKYVGVLGQPSVNYVIQKARGLYRPVLLRNINSKLFIGDYGNKRVVGFDSSSLLKDRDFDFVIGLPNLFSSEGTMGLEYGKYSASDVDSVNGLFILTDTNNHRVLIFDGVPNGLQKPKIILGQPDALSNLSNNGTISSKSLNFPTAAKFIDGKIFVVDRGNNRILVWNSIPASSFAPADFVIGQVDFTTGAPNRGGLRGANTFDYPYALEKVGDKLIVSDADNGRVLIWNSIPSSNVPADSVLGQLSMTTRDYTISDMITFNPTGFKYHQSTLYVSDYDGNRVLVFKNFDINASIPNGRKADIVIGQPDFTSSSRWGSADDRINAYTISNPLGIEVIGNQLLIASSEDNRVMVYNHLPDDILLDKNLAADAIIGQEGFTRGDANRATPGPQYLPEPSNVVVHDGKLFINSEKYGRISVWNSFPKEDFAAADFVLGQNGFSDLDTSSNRSVPPGNPTASTLYVPNQMISHKGKFYVSDLLNNRILIWNSITGQNGQAADEVLGQANMTSKSNSPTLRNTLSSPVGMEVVDNGLIVKDRGNNRILYFEDVPSKKSDLPDSVIGQNDFTSSGQNGGGAVSANTFSAPFNSVSWLGRYVVSDHLNRRILFWNNFNDFINKEPAANVWGQDDLFSFDLLSSLGINRCNNFGNVRVIDNDLHFVDPFNNRILVFSNPSENFYFKPTSVIGQKDFDSNDSITTTNKFSVHTLDLPVGIYAIDNYNFIADYLNHRVLIIPK